MKLFVRPTQVAPLSWPATACYSHEHEGEEDDAHVGVCIGGRVLGVVGKHGGRHERHDQQLTYKLGGRGVQWP